MADGLIRASFDEYERALQRAISEAFSIPPHLLGQTAMCPFDVMIVEPVIVESITWTIIVEPLAAVKDDDYLMKPLTKTAMAKKPPALQTGTTWQCQYCGRTVLYTHKFCAACGNPGIFPSG